MTNLKAGSGSTVMPVQGPQICPILGDFWWPSNRRFVDPEPSLKGLRSAERSVLLFFNGPRTDFAQGVKCGPQTDCPVYIYIYIYIVFFFLSMRRITYLSICVSACLSICQSNCRFIYPLLFNHPSRLRVDSIHPSGQHIEPHVYWSILPSIYPSICLPSVLLHPPSLFCNFSLPHARSRSFYFFFALFLYISISLYLYISISLYLYISKSLSIYIYTGCLAGIGTMKV